VNINTQRGQESGYCTLNPLIGVSTGKWYYEAEVVDRGGELSFGIADDNFAYENYSNTYCYVTDARKLLPGPTTSSYGSAASNGDIIGIAFDLNARTIEVFKNGISMGVLSPSVNSEVTYFPALFIPAVTTTEAEARFNFGQKPFKFPPPAGFQPLALANTPRPSIVRPDQYVGVTTYTGKWKFKAN
jgi:ATP-dependent RNA helicase DDX1